MLYGVLAFTALAIAVLALFRRARHRLREGQATEVERRFENVLSKLGVEIDRFKLTRQGTVKLILNHDHAIWTHVEELASEGRDDRETLRVRVHRYVEEIVPFFKPLAYYAFGLGIARFFLARLYRLDWRPEEVGRIKEFSKARPRSVVYLMNHRSNVDYVLAAYVLAEKIALSFAVGEWARVWPLEYVFKSFGSYFLRRGFRDPLYHTVLRRYVQLVTKSGVTQALFPEGGLSRDGLLRPPKIGLLDSIVCSKEDRSFRRELVFVPVAINYDRVLEDRALVAELQEKRPRGSRLSMARHVGRILFRNAFKLYRKQIRKNGIAAVRFGEPVSFDLWHAELGVDIFALSKDERRARIAAFTDEMMARVAALVPVTPLCLVARSLLAHAPTSRAALEQAVESDMQSLEARGVEVIGREQGPAWLVDGALLRWELRHMFEIRDGVIRVMPGNEPVLRYYANAIAHHLDGAVPKVEAPVSLEAVASG
jgi:glycerol-3-phosphate O-acyltransferase